MFRVLFVCTGKSGRSLMASCFAKAIAPKYVEIVTAGDKSLEIDPMAKQVMKEISCAIPDKTEHCISELTATPFEIVVTLCNKANELCPIFPGSPARIHWALKDPGSIKSKKERLEAFREMRDEIKSRVSSLIKFGFVESIRDMRNLFKSLLNNLTDGIIAHDMERKIFFVNEAAEKITGYSRADLIGRDCHIAFPFKFCGGDCAFCEDKMHHDSKLRYQRIFTKKSGEKVNLEMSVVTLNPNQSRTLGALVIFRDVSEVVHLRKRLQESRGFCGIIGQHTSMQKVFNSINELADIKVPILIQGETGTGKELVATALHQLSNRADGPFVPINCGALPEGTLESELFGHVKGAFTGAIMSRKGRFELAEGGTIFLDEIGEISPSMQVKLLRVLQDNCFVPVGGEKMVKVNVRVICATNKDLKLLTQQGLFREDLYYRLAVVPLNLPSLKERQSDIKLLVEHFLDKFSNEIGRKVRDISKEALDLLMNYSFPGNVRELSNAVQYSMIKCNNADSIIRPEHLPPEILEQTVSQQIVKAGRPVAIDKQLIDSALAKVDGNKAKAAKLLGISRTSIYRILEEQKV